MAEYALWRADSPAGAAAFDSILDALDAVRASITAHDATFVDNWSLIWCADEDWYTLAEGSALVHLALTEPA